MSSVTIKNTGVGAIGLPVHGITVPGNGTAEVDSFAWQGAAGHPVVAAYLESGRLEVANEEAEKPAPRSRGGNRNED